VHISNLDMLDGIVSEFNEDAKKLAEAFWPGPLTIIMPKGKKVCKETTAGLDSVGVRMPANEIAREIISRSGVPFSAPSANLSGKPSPTTASDVFADMNGKIPLIIDGDNCDAGVESTVISVLEKTPIILRPGIITKEEIEFILKKEIKVASEVTEGVKDNSIVRSPGMKYKHYAPNAKVTLVKSSLEDFINYIKKQNSNNIFVMCFDGEEKLMPVPAFSYGKSNDPKSQAHNLFSVLREFDQNHAEQVFVRCPATTGVSLAVYNRLIRSAGFNIIEL
jgi:L-threonylcarbamoyladenylate synthase